MVAVTNRTPRLDDESTDTNLRMRARKQNTEHGQCNEEGPGLARPQEEADVRFSRSERWGGVNRRGRRFFGYKRAQRLGDWCCLSCGGKCSHSFWLRGGGQLTGMEWYRAAQGSTGQHRARGAKVRFGNLSPARVTTPRVAPLRMATGAGAGAHTAHARARRAFVRPTPGGLQPVVNDDDDVEEVLHDVLGEGTAAPPPRPQEQRVGTRVRSFSPPPLGWTFQPKVLMGDGATTADKAMAQVFQTSVGPTAAPVKMYEVPRDEVVYLPFDGDGSYEELEALCVAISDAGICSFDCEWNSTEIQTQRPRKAPLTDGRVAVISFATVHPIGSVSTIAPDRRCFVVQLAAYDDDDRAATLLEGILYDCNLVGHNMKGDLTRLKSDFNLTFVDDENASTKQMWDTYDMAKRLLGNRTLADKGAGTSWTADALVRRLTGLALAKDEQCSNWEASKLSDAQVVYAGLDALATLSAFEMLMVLDWNECPAKHSISYNNVNGAGKRQRLVATMGGIVYYRDEEDDSTRDGMLIVKGSKEMEYRFEDHGYPTDAGHDAFGILPFPEDTKALHARLDDMVQAAMRAYEELSADEQEECEAVHAEFYFEFTAVFYEYTEYAESRTEPLLVWRRRGEVGLGYALDDPQGELGEGGQVVEGIMRGLCVIHAERWLNKAMSLVKKQENRDNWEHFKEKCKADIEQLKNIPFADKLEAYAVNKMMEKWSTKYAEPDLARAWEQAWAAEGTSICRSGLNPFGGLPNDNQMLESDNNVFKSFVGRQIQGLTSFVDVAAEVIENKSADDLSFGASMSFTNKSYDVWNGRAFAAVEYMVQRMKKGEPNPFALTLERRSYGVTVFDFPSRRTQELLHTEYQLPRNATIDQFRHSLEHTAACRDKNCTGCDDSWWAIYKMLAEADDEDDLEFDFDFDLLMDQLRTYHTLTPITDVTYTRRLEARLLKSECTLDLRKYRRQNGNGDIDPEKLQQGKAYVHCNCDAYLHYSWCVHACVYCLQKSKVMLKVPPRFAGRIAPPPQGRMAGLGRGGALGYGPQQGGARRQ